VCSYLLVLVSCYGYKRSLRITERGDWRLLRHSNDVKTRLIFVQRTQQDLQHTQYQPNTDVGPPFRRADIPKGTRLRLVGLGLAPPFGMAAVQNIGPESLQSLQGGPKMAPFLYTLTLPVLTDFYFTAGIRRKFVIILSLKIPLHLKCVATLSLQAYSVKCQCIKSNN